MKYFLYFSSALFVLTCSLPALSANLYKWVDEEGNVTYQDTPPPGNVEFEAQEYTVPGEAETEVAPDNALAMEDAARENPVSLYTVPACDVCDLVRLFLENRRIPFVEKNVQSSIPLQQELQVKTGDLSVPTLIVGESSIDGYSKTAITSLLESKGFPLSESDSGSESESNDRTDTELPDVGLEESS
ncbi:MAG: glutaredoxin family protein [Pseudomonadota bacterium]